MFKRKNNSKFEILLIVLIATCMLALIHVSTNKLNEVLLGNKSILLRKNPNNYIEQQLATQMMKYKNKTCTMIEMYDDKFNLDIRIPFVDDYRQKDLKEYKELTELLRKHPEGHTRIHINNEEEDIYFRWTKNNRNEERLVIISISRPFVKYLWLIPFFCYLILILIFILVIKLHMTYQSDKINYYHKTSIRVQNKMLDKIY